MPAKPQSGGKGGLTDEEIVQKAEYHARVNAPRIAAVLGVEPRMVEIELVSGPEVVDIWATPDEPMRGTGVGGWYDGGQDKIFLNAQHANDDTYLEVLIIHELTHAVLAPHQATDELSGDAKGQNKTLFVEGLARYVEKALLGTEGSLTRGESNPREGYEQGASFFQFVEQNQPGAVKAIVRAVAEGDPAPLRETTGMDYDQWVATYEDVIVENNQKEREQFEKWLWLRAHAPGAANLEVSQTLTTQPERLGPHYAEGIDPPEAPSGVPGVITNAIGGSIAFNAEGTIPGTTGAGTADGGREQMSHAPWHTDDGGGGSDDSPSTPSAPAVDPLTAQRMNMFQQLYMQLWGEPAPETYLKSAANGGLNSYEFALQERSKPAWIQSKAFKDSYDGLAGTLSRLGI